MRAIICNLSPYFILNLALPPEITEPPQQNKETVDGTMVELTCRTFGAPKPIVKWFHDNDELTGGRFELRENGDLRIKYDFLISFLQYFQDDLVFN